jgi:hypothetical protein
METRKQALGCRKCGMAGTFEYERPSSVFDPVRFVSLTTGFTYRDDENAKAQRITCKCGEVVYYARNVFRKK